MNNPRLKTLKNTSIIHHKGRGTKQRFKTEIQDTSGKGTVKKKFEAKDVT